MNQLRAIDKEWMGLCRAVMVGVILLSVILPAQARREGAELYTNASLINQDGEVLHFYDDVLKGKIVAINFMYTSCTDSCPLETAKLRHLQKVLGDHVGKDLFMYSITVDPERDTPAVLKNYMKKYKVGPGWQFLTGNEEDIKEIRRRLGMFNEDESEIDEHNVNFILGNVPAGKWIKRTPFDAPQILVHLLLDRLPVTPLRSRKTSYAEVRTASNYDKGEDMFRSRCSVCHTIGKGDGLGPDLLDVVERRDRDWLVRWLKSPATLLEQKDPIALSLFENFGRLPMPDVKLTDFDIENLLRYMQEQSQQIKARAAARQLQQSSYFQPIFDWSDGS